MGNQVVYGMYERGKTQLLYVGRTCGTLEVRFRAHLSLGVKYYCRPHEGILPSTRLYGYWMFKHVAGVVELELIALSNYINYWTAADMERGLIARHQPPLNTRLKAEPEWYSRKKRFKAAA